MDADDIELQIEDSVPDIISSVSSMADLPSEYSPPKEELVPKPNRGTTGKAVQPQVKKQESYSDSESINDRD